jgi:hypothetical protein
VSQVDISIGAVTAAGSRPVTTKTINPNSGTVLSTTMSTSSGPAISVSQAVPVVLAKAPTTGPDYGTISQAGEAQIGYTETYSSALTTDFVWQAYSTFCWGGGVPGVHWGYVYRCGYFGTQDWPDSPNGYFTRVNGYFISNAHWNSNAASGLFAWSNMNYSINTGFHDWQQGYADYCVFHYGCLSSYYPVVQMWEHANGEWDAAGS